MKRTCEKLRLSHSPLSLVLCQVRFSPLLAMGEYIPRIQDRMRRTGYPVNASTPIQELQFGPTGAVTRDRVHWEFVAKDQRSSVVVAEGFVVLQTTSYDDFETFIAQIKSVVSTVNEVVDAIVIQRVGLRYVDAIVPKSGESWRDYVQPSLHGFESRLFKEDSALRLHQTVAATDTGTMLVRIHQNREGATLPPDLGTGALKPAPSTAKKGETITLLDIDHFHVCDNVEYAAEHFESVAWTLKNASYEVFVEHLVTPHALKVWR
jgi:uncharacterized protein (TIGR04255 family)